MDTTPPAVIADPPPRNLEQDVVDLIQTMGQSLNMVLLYGVTHKVARGALDRSYPVVLKFIEFHEHIHFSVSEGSLLINGTAAAGAPLSTQFISRLTGLNLLSFTIEAGFPMEEYLKLYTLLITPPAKLDASRSASEMMESLGFRHVQAKSFAYRRVAEGSDSTEPAAPTPAPSQADSPTPPPAQEPASPADLDNIMAFLKDDPSADPVRCAEAIRQLADDSEKLAELILRTVEIRASTANLAEGESLSDLVVGCIQKVVDQVIKDPAVKTQKGQKHIKRSLLMLEKALLERLQNLAGDHAAKAAETMLDEIAEDLDLDALAGKYMKSRRAAEKAGEKLSRLLDRVSDDPGQLEALHGRLAQEGLTPEGWRELTVRRAQATASGPGSGGGGDGAAEGANEIKVLTLLLARLGETINHPSATPGETAREIQTLVAETETRLASLAAITERKIGSLKQTLTGDDQTQALSREEILRILAEIAQEISQPLTIITGTVAMLRSLRAGPLTEMQGELLSMVAESGNRMIHLVECLMRMAGTPDALHPDQAILATAYRKE